MATMYEKYLLESTGDSTDMTEKIEAMLKEHGVCILDNGTFYVRGVEMPDNTTLMGMGSATQLLLAPEITDGFTVKIGSFCTVKNLSVIGSKDFIPLPESIEKRHGLLFKGAATASDWSNQPRNSIVESCHIRSFTGGGLAGIDTGYSIVCSLTASNCHIINCGAGIYIPHYSEYHEFTNMLCAQNLYGCINNGGNNTFVNCGFNSNKTGFLIDNTGGKSPNNSHGSVVGCTFNHTDGNKGIGIKLIGAQHGFVFTGCQNFYSDIVVENSTNILFSNFNFGANQKITVNGGKTVMFTDNLFLGAPTITVSNNDNVKFINCFAPDGSEIK